MAILPSFACPYCSQLIISREFDGSIKAPMSYADCLRQCEACGVGFSNANSGVPEDLTPILREPFAGIPDSIAFGWQDVFARSLNVTNRKSKLARIASLNSEDHVTWTIFRYLQEHKRFRSCLSALNLDWISTTTEEPTLLLWGVPVPLCDVNGKAIRDALVCVLESIGEGRTRYSEPDVILDFGQAGLIFIEVKLKSPNDSKEPNERWQKYFKGPIHSSPSEPFVDVEAIRQSGLYELMRNWRIAWDLARERPMALVNLGPDQLFSDKTAGAKLRKFQKTLSQSASRRFIPLTWSQLLKSVPNQAEWFQEYAKRRIPSS